MKLGPRVFDDYHNRRKERWKLVLGSLMMLTGAPNSGVTGGRTMLLAGAILGQGVRNVVDTSATHNIIDVVFLMSIG